MPRAIRTQSACRANTTAGARTEAGSVFAEPPFPVEGAVPTYRSVAPTDEDADLLRAAAARRTDIPDAIADALSSARDCQRAGEREACGRSPMRDHGQADRTTTIRPSRSTTTSRRTCKYNLQAPAAPADSDRVEYFLTVKPAGLLRQLCRRDDDACPLCRHSGARRNRLSSGQAGRQGRLSWCGRRTSTPGRSSFSRVSGWVPFDATEGAEDISDHSQHTGRSAADFVAWLLSHGMLPPLLVAGHGRPCSPTSSGRSCCRACGRRDARRATDGRPATNRAVVQAYLRGLRRPGAPRPAPGQLRDAGRVPRARCGPAWPPRRRRRRRPWRH